MTEEEKNRQTGPQREASEPQPIAPASTPPPEARPQRETLPARGGGSLTTALTAVTLIAVLLLGYGYYAASSKVGALQAQVAALTGDIQTLTADLAKASSLISSQAGANGSSGFDVNKLYTQSRESVVLIKSILPGQGAAQGSGFVYDAEGRIITNNHVVEGASSLTVTFIDGTIVSATIVGRDPYSDIAVIKVNAPNLPTPLKLADSTKVVVGEPVVAIGNPYGLADTITSGIISATGREMDGSGGYLIADVIQTDAPINPGNSGGPLINARGEVVGINTAIPSQTSNGIGFAVPSSTILRELPSLISKGTYDHAYLGITASDVSPSVAKAMALPETTRGVLVDTVAGPSATAGLKGGTQITTIDGVRVRIGGDIVVSVDGNPVRSFYDLIVYIQRNKAPNQTVKLSVLRGGSATDVTVTLGVRPAAQ